MKPGRVQCCVPHCRRTVAAERIGSHTEWICSNHWPLVPKRLRSLKIKSDRAYERAKEVFYRLFHECDEYARSHNGTVSDESSKRLHEANDRREKECRRCRRLWDRCKRRAIETAMGI